jgi:hypothetical protein
MALAAAALASPAVGWTMAGHPPEDGLHFQGAWASAPWSAPREPQPPGGIFRDGFESGDTRRWVASPGEPLPGGAG